MISALATSILLWPLAPGHLLASETNPPPDKGIRAADITQTNQVFSRSPSEAIQSAGIAKKKSWRPTWLTEVSLGFREGYDNNVYASGVARRYYPGSFVGPVAGSVQSLKNHGSFFEVVTPRVAADLAKLQGPDAALQSFALSYAPELYRYNDAPSENYIAHKFGATIAAVCHDFALQLDEGFTYIDGEKLAPTYPGKYYDPIGQGLTRERREQWQDRTALTLTYDQPDWFFRTTGSLLDYNLKTDQIAVPTAQAGYVNYVDRYDINGGADLGYKVLTNFAFTAGYRAGHQYQQKLPSAIDPYGQTSTADYQRFLLGFEGSPLNWLKLKVQAGPDFRNYNANAPVRDDNPVTFYGESSLTAKATKDDTISLGYRHWRWVSSTGMVPDDESTYELNYKHQFNSQWSARLGLRVQSADYSCGEAWASGLGLHSPATALTNFKNQWDYTYSAGVQYDITTSLSLDLAYTAILGRNAQDRADLALSSGSQLPALKRQFDDQTVSLGAKYKF